jgi:LysR family transcriptional regulator, glycine cleavage system transcriptional activator
MNSRRRDTPDIPELLAFEAAARLCSFTKAAEELALTQGAISRQINNLEAKLGVPLFERVRRSVVLTDAGALYIKDVDQILSLVRQSGERISGFAAENVLNLAVLPTFATRWLIPAMPGFLKGHAELQVNYLVKLSPFNFEAEPFDAAIHFGNRIWPGADLHPLCGEDVVAVARPTLVMALGLKDLTNIRKAALLHQTTRPFAWEEWLAYQNVSHPHVRSGPRLEQFAMVLEAAVAGMGVALVPRFLAETEIARGDLFVLPGKPFRTADGYWLAIPHKKRSLPRIVAFREWLTSATAELRAN